MNAATPYRTLFVGILHQNTAMSVGGRDTPGSVADASLCRDGLNRFTLRGQTLAGALIATARQLGVVPDYISGGEQTSGNTPPPSRWRTFASHPIGGNPTVEMRQHVRIDAKTGAALDNALFNIEILPAGVDWPFLLEVDSTGMDGANAEAIAWHALGEWLAGRCYIGREVARGLGWMDLRDLKVVRLSSSHEHLRSWPNSLRADDYPTYVRELASRFGTENQMTPPQWLGRTESGWSTVEIPFHIHVGEKADGYGLDSLSIGGHAESEVLAEWQDDDHFLMPHSLNPDECAGMFDPDFALVMSGPTGQRQPIIPGSSLRGPLRHALERYYKSSGEWGSLKETLRQFFGDLAGSDVASQTLAAALLVSDAHLSAPPWKAAWFQLHAEDEFTAGAFGSSKFDRIGLVKGKFSGKLVLQAPTQSIVLFQPLLTKLKELAHNGQIALGGGQWRGHGWVRWEFETDLVAGEHHE